MTAPTTPPLSPSDDDILRIGRQAVSRHIGTNAQHIYIAREAIRLASAKQTTTPPDRASRAAQAAGVLDVSRKALKACIENLHVGNAWHMAQDAIQQIDAAMAHNKEG